MLRKAIDQLPAGRWAVGVSGGADSVALLLLLADRSDLFLHVVHLDHETRDGESAVDAQFVAELSASMHINCTIERRSAIEATLPTIAPNLSNRFRLARFELFRRVVNSENLAGVVLAHHADDQAETILMRVLRGSAVENLAGIQPEAMVNGLKIVRPLLNIPSLDLREFLQSKGQIWREDASNASDKYQRNRLRQWLRDQPGTRVSLMQVGQDSDALRAWLEANAPVLDPTFSIEKLNATPPPLARHSATRWLIASGAPPTELNTKTCDRLIEMAKDAASPPRQHFPGGLLVRRKQGMVFVHPRREPKFPV